MFKCSQRSCGYTWSENTLAAEVDLDLGRSADVLSLHCPACGEPYGDSAKASHLGVVQLKRGDGTTVSVQWDGAAPGSQGVRLVGAVQPCRPADICYPSVPLLLQADGTTVVVPDLPVRPEYLGLVDWAELERTCRDQNGLWQRPPNGGGLGAFRVTDGKYVAHVPLIGRKDPYSVELPVVGKDFRRVTRKEDAIAGIDLGVWPKVRSALWKTYLVRCTATDQGATMVDEFTKLGGSLTVRPFVSRGEDLLEIDARDGLVTPVRGSSVFGARVRQSVISTAGAGRPTQVVIEGARNGVAEWGGVFLPLPALSPGNNNGATETIGVDFGTSNSCVSFKSLHSKEPRTFGVHGVVDLEEWLVRSRNVSDALSADQYSVRFARRGFGTRDAILPTELLTSQVAAAALGEGVAAIDRWVPGRDYAIPGSDVVWERRTGPAPGRGTEPIKQAIDIEPHLVTGFKWKELDGGRMGGDGERPALMAAYLRCLFVHELALAFAAAEAGKDRPQPYNPAAIAVVATHPGKWSTQEVNLLGQALLMALAGNGDSADCVQAWVQVSFVKNAATGFLATYKNESLAAAEASLSGHSVHSALVGEATHLLDAMVDIGGGSTDIALVWRGIQPRLEFEALSSVRYAGEDVIYALDGGGDPVHRTFVHGMGKSDLRYQLRRTGPTDALFDSTKRNSMTRRLTAFYVQLAEFMARLIAAQVANGEFALHNGRDVDVLHVRLTLMGSGWGLAALPYGGEFGEEISQKVGARANELLSELYALDGALTKVRVDVNHIAPPAGLHPKFAVAAGAAGAYGDGAGGAIAEVRYATLLRFGKTGDDLDQKGPANREIVGLPAVCRGRAVEWWRIVEAPAEVARYNPLAHGEILKVPTLDWSDVVAATGGQDARSPGARLAGELCGGFGGESLRAGLAVDKDAVIHQVFGPGFQEGFLRRGLFSALLEKGLRSRLKSL